MSEPRIRWHDEPVNGESMGSVGTLDPAVFRIWAPEVPGGEWLLTAAMLPGFVGRRSHGASPDELKAEAERWLEEFVSSLGVSLAVTPDARWQALKDHLSEQIVKNLEIAESFQAPPDATTAGIYRALASAHRSTLGVMKELEAGQ